MAFYEELSEFYDGLFRTDADELSFVNSLIRDCGMILDVGCGTGNKTELLSAGNGRIYAFDSSPLMIEKAVSMHYKDSITYKAFSIQSMKEYLSGMSFDAALCLGNTLVHLDRKGMEDFLEDLHSLMLPGGVFIAQILNYKYILDAGITELPALMSDKARLNRSYSFQENGLGFDTELMVNSGGIFKNSVLLQPLKKDELNSSLENAGFKNIKYFGSYDGSAFREDSFVLIAVCTA